MLPLNVDLLKPMLMGKLGKLNVGSDSGNARSALRLPMRLSPTSSRRPSFLSRKTQTSFESTYADY